MLKVRSFAGLCNWRIPSSSRSGGAQSVKGIEEIGEYLASTRAKYYTCHCTGMGPFNILRAAIGEKVNYLHAGSQVDLVEIQN